MFCTFCLNENGEVLFFLYEETNENDKVPVIKKHFGFLEDRIASSSICENCWRKVIEFHDFYVSVQENNNFVDVKGVQSFTQFEFQNESFESGKVQVKVEDADATENINYEMSYFDDSDDTNSDSNLMEDSDEINESKETKKRRPYKKPEEKGKINATKSETYEVPVHKKVTEESEKLIKEHIKLTCELCDYIGTGYMDVLSHYRHEHQTKGYLKCCDIKFNKRSILVDHIKYHLDSNVFKCDICNKTCKNKKNLSIHKTLHEVPTHKCTEPGCEKLFSRNYQLQMHIRSAHGVKEGETIKCPECDKLCTSVGSLAYHRKNEHVNKNRSWYCDICGNAFKTNANLQYHRTSHNLAEIEMVQCKICDKYFRKGSSFYKHSKRHSDREHPCSECGRICPNLHALKCHFKRVHILQPTHQCSICSKAFKSKQGLKEHMASHGNSQVLYQCSVCMKSFNSSANMHSHRKKMHPEEWKMLVKEREEAITKKTKEILEANAAAKIK